MVVDRIFKILEFKGLNKNRFYKETGFSNGFLDKVKDIGSSKIEHILEIYPDINPEWLLTGKGEMLRSSSETLPKEGYPLLSMEAFAGPGDSSVFGDELQRVTERYDIPLFKGLQVDFMISVKGSSMYPKYNSGDVVACRIINEVLFIQWNKVYVLDTKSQGVILKRLKPSENSDMVICKSDNDSYDPFEIPKTDICKMAMVVGVVRLE